MIYIVAERNYRFGLKQKSLVDESHETSKNNDRNTTEKELTLNNITDHKKIQSIHLFFFVDNTIHSIVLISKSVYFWNLKQHFKRNFQTTY